MNYNSAAQPGVVIMRQGNTTLRRRRDVLRDLYLRNEQGSTHIVADIGGNGGVVGSVTIDGAGRAGRRQQRQQRHGNKTSNITYASNAFRMRRPASARRVWSEHLARAAPDALTMTGEAVALTIIAVPSAW